MEDMEDEEKDPGEEHETEQLEEKAGDAEPKDGALSLSVGTMD